MAEAVDRLAEAFKKMAVAFYTNTAATTNVYVRDGFWITAGTNTTTGTINEWAWNNVGTTATGNWVTVNHWDVETDDQYFTGGVPVQEQETYRRELRVDGRIANYDDFFRVVTGSDPAWAKANETQEEREVRERQYFVRSIMRTGTNLLGANVENDPVFDLERLIGTTEAHATSRFREYSHYLPFTEEETRELEDMWQRRREETIALHRRQEEARVAEAERQQRHAVAERRAEQLLLELLSRKQKEEWLEFKRVTEVAPSGRVWRLFPLWSGGASIMEGNVRRATLCIHGAEWVPNADNMAMLLMTIRGDEERMIRVGILHGGQWSDEEKRIRRVRQSEIDAAAGAVAA